MILPTIKDATDCLRIPSARRRGMGRVYAFMFCTVNFYPENFVGLEFTRISNNDRLLISKIVYVRDFFMF